MAKDNDDLSGELHAIKMLLILQLLRQGVKQNQIAAILGISDATMSRMLPKGISKTVLKGATTSAIEGIA